MKGVVFNLLEDFIEENMGEGAYEEILDRCTLKAKGPFVGPGTYPDEALISIIAETVRVAGVPLPETLRSFGRHCFSRLSEKNPGFVTPFSHPKPFLKSVESIVHVEVKKLYQDAKPPEFTYIDPAPDRLVIQYRSMRRLCHFMEGLIDGASEYYKSPIKHWQRRCMLEGGEVCEFDLAFENDHT